MAEEINAYKEKEAEKKGKAAEREKGSFRCLCCTFLAGFFLDRTSVFSFCACLLYGSLWSGTRLVKYIPFCLEQITGSLQGSVSLDKSPFLPPPE